MGIVYDARDKFYRRIAETVKCVTKKEGPISGALRLHQIRTLTPKDKEIIKMAMVK